MTATMCLGTTATWEKTDWQGERAWASSQNNVRAVVTEARARLIYLGAEDGSLNLLNAPSPQVLPDKNNPWPNQGGHRFWLGPQHRWVWPPPADWEYSAAQNASTEAGVLTLQHAHTNKDYPAIAREYAWEGNSLRCTARWKDDGQAHFGLHVVAVNTPFAISVHLEKAKDVPNGLVAARMVDPASPIRLPHPSITIEGDVATIRSEIKTTKLGFVPQPLTIDRQLGWKLSVQPGPSTVATNEAPDQGYLSQVWVGDKTNDIAELEQLTPQLKGDASGNCSSTIYIVATPPAR
ncbi:MAG: hypothetical protein IPP19_07400 [Verrucomicrobia bacterium]|nr:hypothetical protein [Verrucomicrobiota bacterium]